MENDKTGRYWVKLRHLKNDYTGERPKQDIRTMSREKAETYKHRGNWFQRAKSYLELMKHDVEIDDKKLLNNINDFLDLDLSSFRGGMITDAEVAQADAVLDNAILYLESIAS